MSELIVECEGPRSGRVDYGGHVPRVGDTLDLDGIDVRVTRVRWFRRTADRAAVVVLSTVRVFE